MKIPFTNKKLQVKTTNGCSTCNGNGYKIKTLSISIITILGNGDDGSRCLSEPSLKGK